MNRVAKYLGTYRVKCRNNTITDLMPVKDTFIIKIDIQGFECKVNYSFIIHYVIKTNRL